MRCLLALILSATLRTQGLAAEEGGPGFVYVQGLPKAASGKQSYSIYVSELRYGGFQLVNKTPVESGDYCIGALRAGKTYHLKVTKGQAGDPSASSLLRTWDEVAQAGACSGDLQSPPEVNARALLSGITATTAALRAVPRKNELVFGYGKQGPKSSLGTDWEAANDGGVCGSYLTIPKPGQSLLISWSCARWAGYLGGSQWESSSCKAVSFVVASLSFKRAGKNLNLAAAGIPRKGLRLLLRLGPGHPLGRQDYGVFVHRFSISGDMKEYKGNGYGTPIKGDTLSRDEWREVKVDFPAEGATVRQPATTFAQNEWIPAEMNRPWGTNDLTHLDIVASKHERNFDLLIGGIAFY